MRRTVISILLLCIALYLGGCQTPKQYMAKHGQPDLISDETGTYLRMYLPDDTVEKWRNATTILFYLDEKLQVSFKQGQVKKAAIPDDEIETLLATKTLLEVVDSGDRFNW